jgi:hypothetical protein
MQHILQAIILTFAVIVAVVLAGQEAGKYRVIKAVEVKNEAVQGCLEVGYEEYTNPGQNSRAVTYNPQAYEFCMKEKGY